MNIVRRLVEYIAGLLPPPRIIYDRAGGSPYLSRYYLYGTPSMQDGSHPFETDGSPKSGIDWGDRRFGVYLHRFHRGDDDEELHNHPWKWALSLVLVGGYIEFRRLHGRFDRFVVQRTIRPFQFNFIRQNDFHRVELHNGEAWTLFIVGPKVSSWSFWNQKTNELTHWREFIDRKRGEVR